MNDLDNRFFEAYKRLDRLCGDIFSCHNGVSTYISEMEANSKGMYSISSWKDTYYKLKHCRWLRNKLSHEDVYGICEVCDLQFINEFYNRILSGQDPLSLLNRKFSKNQASSAQSQAFSDKRVHSAPNTPVQDSRLPRIAIVLITALVIVLLFSVFFGICFFDL